MTPARNEQMNPLTIGIILAIYAFIMWIMVMMVFKRGYRDWKANRPEKLHEARARVMDRRTEANPDAVRGDRYYLTLEYDGRQQEFEVIEAIYTSSRVGQAGTLHLRGGRFEDFEPRPEGEGWDEIYSRMVKK